MCHARLQAGQRESHPEWGEGTACGETSRKKPTKLLSQDPPNPGHWPGTQPLPPAHLTPSTISKTKFRSTPFTQQSDKERPVGARRHA